jgi:hypothetical protein
MSRIGDFLESFKPGPTKRGTWRQLEEFGRFEGTGEVSAELELPETQVAVSVEGYLEVENLEFKLTGPGGTALQLKRYSAKNFDTSDAAESSGSASRAGPRAEPKPMPRLKEP